MSQTETFEDRVTELEHDLEELQEALSISDASVHNLLAENEELRRKICNLENSGIIKPSKEVPSDETLMQEILLTVSPLACDNRGCSHDQGRMEASLRGVSVSRDFAYKDYTSGPPTEEICQELITKYKEQA
jgi:hypothetical protein